MNTYYYADFPALLALLSHLPDDIFQHEFIDERLRWRNGELTKFCPVCPIPKANKGSFAQPRRAAESAELAELRRA